MKSNLSGRQKIHSLFILFLLNFPLTTTCFIRVSYLCQPWPNSKGIEGEETELAIFKNFSPSYSQLISSISALYHSDAQLVEHKKYQEDLPDLYQLDPAQFSDFFLYCEFMHIFRSFHAFEICD